MKKKITTILFIGVIALISMGFRSQCTGDDFSGGSTITIIKGEVINSDKDKDWDGVTFGLAGLNPKKEYIVYAEILDQKGAPIGQTDDLTSLLSIQGVSWYAIDLSHFKIHKEFTLEVHVLGGEGRILNNLSTLAIDTKSTGAPIDPEETILIVKYP
ncbi:MAG: hypothetical protein WC865_00760 [Bacteroidales bacterium]